MKQQFGGDWTERKLAIIKKYLTAYMSIMKNQPFRVAYIDAFAGTGFRQARTGCLEDAWLFPEDEEAEARDIRAGSARIALEVKPPFHRYIYIEKNANKCTALEQLRIDYHNLKDRIDIRQGEANEEIKRLCQEQWKQHRAVMFLDPFGMQVAWDTIQSIASTKAIDLWYLFPLGMGMNRLLVHRLEDMPVEFSTRLDLVIGDLGWRDRFYRKRVESGLFSRLEIVEKDASFAGMREYLVERLQTVFFGVAEHPVFLYNSKRNPMFLLCFAASNEKGAKTAIKIANDLLRGINE